MEPFILQGNDELADTMTFAEYVATSLANHQPQYDENSITRMLNPNTAGLTRGYCDGYCGDTYDYDKGFGIPPILVASFPQPLFKIYDFNYSDETYSFLFKLIHETLKGIECLDVKYEAEEGRWLCVYGTKPIKRQLSPAQMVVYLHKNALLSRNFNEYCLDSISFETIYLTNILKLPFNCFMKAGVCENMRARLRTEIRFKAREMFPHLATGQTPWSEYYGYVFEDDDFISLTPRREWSKIEIVLRKDISKNKLDVFYNRITGDRTSSSFVMSTLKDSLERLVPADFIWNVRSNYLKFVEGCQCLKYNHIERYILNELLVREIASYFVY